MAESNRYYDESAELEARLTQAIADRDRNQREIAELSSQLTLKKEETFRQDGYIAALQQMMRRSHQSHQSHQSHRPHQYGVLEWYNPNHSQNSFRHVLSEKSAEEMPTKTPTKMPKESPNFNETVKESVIEIMKDEPEIQYLLSSLGMKLKKKPYSLTFKKGQLVNILNEFKDDFIVCCACDENPEIKKGQDYVKLILP